MFDLTDRTWLWMAAACYGAGFLLGTFGVLRERRQWPGMMYGIIAIGYALQTIGLYVRGHAVGGCPLGNAFELFQFTGWSATTLYLVVGATFRLSLLGYFTSMLAASVSLIALAIPAWDATRRAHIFGGNAWIEFHAALALFSYGVFGLLALTSIMYLLRNYSLKNKRLSGIFSFLPPIVDLDQINVRLLATGVLLLAASLGVGSVYWVQATETVNITKILMTAGVWIAFCVTLILRWRGALAPKRLAWTCIVLFGAALVSLPFVDASRHPVPANIAMISRS